MPAKMALLIEVLRVIVQGSWIPIALQKTGGKYCTNCNHNDQLTYFMYAVANDLCITQVAGSQFLFMRDLITCSWST